MIFLLELIAGAVCSVIGLVVLGVVLLIAYENSGPKLVFTCTRCRHVETWSQRGVDARAAALAICPKCNAQQSVTVRR